MQTHPTLSLVEHFKNLTDPRINPTKDHALIDVLVIAVCTLLCGGEGFNDMEDFGKAKQEWFRTFLTLTNGIPSHDTFNRVFAPWIPTDFWSASCVGPRACVKRSKGRSSLSMVKPCVGR